MIYKKLKFVKNQHFIKKKLYFYMQKYEFIRDLKRTKKEKP